MTTCSWKSCYRAAAARHASRSLSGPCDVQMHVAVVWLQSWSLASFLFQAIALHGLRHAVPARLWASLCQVQVGCGYSHSSQVCKGMIAALQRACNGRK